MTPKALAVLLLSCAAQAPDVSDRDGWIARCLMDRYATAQLIAQTRDDER